MSFSRVSAISNQKIVKIFLKDSQFIDGLLAYHVSLLTFCLYTSTMDYNDVVNAIPLGLDLHRHTFTFNDIYRLFEICLPLTFEDKPVYEVIQIVILHLSDSIRFIISNNRLGIAPELETLLRDFLHTLEIVDRWAVSIALIGRLPDDTSLKKQVIDMIKEEPLPPTRRPHNLINAFIAYYETLVIYKAWVIDYTFLVGRLTKAAPAPDSGT